MKHVFTPADILLPKKGKMEDWAVIACDQFSSEKEYWDRVSHRVEKTPSTLHMVVPEAWLGEVSMEEASRERNETMAKYVNDDLFQTYPNTFVYVEREISGGKIRRGVVGKLDLEAYDFRAGVFPPARASEKTVIERLPPRIKVRSSACLEMPHVLVLIDDEGRHAVEPLTEQKSDFEVLYDFDLMEEGGHITGYRLTPSATNAFVEAIDCLGTRDVQFVIGDGNHSLAAAKEIWREVKKSLSPDQIHDHPARFALVEVCNVYDDGIEFEPIHRIVFDGDPNEILNLLAKHSDPVNGRPIRYLNNGKEGELLIRNESLGSLIGIIESVLDTYAKETSAVVDYIHDEASLIKLAERENSLALFMPLMNKADLFQTVERSGVFPKKSFSIGHARDKRYYLECRKIKK